ncbi:MAG: ribosome biogenesis GTP-binding protein YihA/YsxC [Gammaproteobacteria bacterium]
MGAGFWLMKNIAACIFLNRRKLRAIKIFAKLENARLCAGTEKKRRARKRGGVLFFAAFFPNCYNAAVIDFRNPKFLGGGWTARGVAPGRRVAAFAGRSNAGKSSALNALCGGRFARAAKAPGRTRMINLFALAGGHALADLPGYGYAKVSREERRDWGENIARFLREPCIAGAVLVADARRGVGESDMQFLALADGLPVLLLLNKSDKLGRNELRRRVLETEKMLAEVAPHVFAMPFSALKKNGVGEARAAVAKLLEE